MGWERGGRYYMRSRREGGRVVREYVGTGLLAQFEADRDRRRRERETAERRAWREYQEELVQLLAPLDEVNALGVLIMRATLVAEGFHQHDRGHWRKQRRGKKAEAV